ncbi:MAG: prepilin-type N-terminal cleavage/methylation domain-containing protein [Bacteroidia bacterium]|nr:prepilin-type N-terminal cleavage/methylation domain-containing protein [Bacteroidia bacterium]MCF8446779.1 prepilin-type N-terminal cleavage/methylation domain-containing protein [Bacteroidia bacterium]
MQLYQTWLNELLVRFGLTLIEMLLALAIISPRFMFHLWMMFFV